MFLLAYLLSSQNALPVNNIRRNYINYNCYVVSNNTENWNRTRSALENKCNYISCFRVNMLDAWKIGASEKRQLSSANAEFLTHLNLWKRIKLSKVPVLVCKDTVNKVEIDPTTMLNNITTYFDCLIPCAFDVSQSKRTKSNLNNIVQCGNYNIPDLYFVTAYGIRKLIQNQWFDDIDSFITDKSCITTDTVKYHEVDLKIQHAEDQYNTYLTHKFQNLKRNSIFIYLHDSYFDVVQLISVISCIYYNAAQTIVLIYNDEPTANPFWDLCKSLQNVIIHEIEMPRFVNNFLLKSKQEKITLAETMLLNFSGGICFPINSICIKRFDTLLDNAQYITDGQHFKIAQRSSPQGIQRIKYYKTNISTCVAQNLHNPNDFKCLMEKNGLLFDRESYWIEVDANQRSTLRKYAFNISTGYGQLFNRFLQKLGIDPLKLSKKQYFENTGTL